MKEWIPIPGSNKETLIKVALEEFSLKGYKGVNITELAAKANMTTGAVYHHFGSKLKLYEVIRNEMEQRMLDRMEGAAALFDEPTEALEAALITGLNFAVKANICKLLSEENSSIKEDKIEEFLSNLNSYPDLPIQLVLSSSWRYILKGLSENQLTIDQGKNLIRWIFKKEF
ncbi:TetR/AcrR family transcriptional regulator [Bacillus sp. 31A1R]|uniref:TetR/AcrR family transcriptional regulator n=1 Tax=Robertmurraya mangrovi TaxID=3098077 RepID=A0ABU5IZZ0_9BACI|nr:TetR/AcrR family transcriptional regulator [Bacillus sp. 31A1R]MDZ5472725.1 TetR/AcrR family transcriptional regulator [Bacillus sp. 31A1R]